MSFTEFRLRLRHFFRKNKNIIIAVFIIWSIIFLINIIIKNVPRKMEAQNTYEAHVSIMDTRSSTPTSLKKPIEDIIEEYVKYCNEGNFASAFNMLSDDCKKYEFNDSLQDFMDYVYTKMPTPKKYSIQDYSNVRYGNRMLYIYEIKYTDDLLATGLTGSTYSFTSENICANSTKSGLIS